MKLKHYILIFSAFLIFVISANGEEKQYHEPDYVYHQPAGEVGFTRLDLKADGFLADGVYMAKPLLKTPLASDTVLNISSHSLTLYPGAVIKKKSNHLSVLGGRVMVESDNKRLDPLIFKSKRYLCHYNYGKLLIETTPLKNSWILMKKNGSAWVKTSSRKIIELQVGTEVEIPLFGAVNIGERPSPRWNLAPEVAVVKDVRSVFSPTNIPEETNGSITRQLESEASIASHTDLATDTNSEVE